MDKDQIYNLMNRMYEECAKSNVGPEVVGYLPKKELIPLDEFNGRQGATYTNGRRPNGIACPECGEEMYEYPMSPVYMSLPPQKDIYCACGFKGRRVA